MMPWINGGGGTAWTQSRGWSTRPLGDFEAPEPPVDGLLWSDDSSLLWSDDSEIEWNE